MDLLNTQSMKTSFHFTKATTISSTDKRRAGRVASVSSVEGEENVECEVREGSKEAVKLVHKSAMKIVKVKKDEITSNGRKGCTDLLVRLLGGRQGKRRQW
ncbi:hypothetical protein ACSQ67_023763 [Phaseolus vulgaris]